jgi:excinuclease ABC subunit C
MPEAAGAAGESGGADREEQWAKRLENLPAQPGCYVFRDRTSAVLYVGKAKSLRSRVRSYFQFSSNDERAFIPWLRLQLGEIETIITASEKEAAILENSLIKEYRPKYNVKLRDDKEFLNLRLDAKSRYSRLELVRRPNVDGARYFGPYPSATAARRTLHLVERHFQLRTCSDRELASRKRPCIQYQIKRCPAPCVYEIDEEAYRAQVHAVSLFLEGRHNEVTDWLKDRMRQASADLNFELAGTLRDQVAAIDQVREAQRVVSVSDRDVDVLGIYRQGELVELVLLLVRSGRLVDVQRLSRVRADVDDAEVVAAFLREQYANTGSESAIADEIWLPVMPEGAEGIEEWLNDLTPNRSRRVKLVVPQRGKKTELLQLAADNARHAFEEKRRSEQDVEARLARLANRLRLPKLPHRIECVDISHLGGTDSVGAVVALLDGKPDKSHYRTYRIRRAGMGDDYGAIFEVLSRRFRRGAAARELAARDLDADGIAAVTAAPVEERSPESDVVEDAVDDVADDVVDDVADETDESALNDAPDDEASASSFDEGDELGELEKAATPDVLSTDTSEPSTSAEPIGASDSAVRGADWSLPDLFVIDGGRGQLAVALAAAEDLGLKDLPIVGLAKEKESPTGEKLVDRVYLPGQKNPIPLRPGSPELFFLSLVRDEAHRFSNRGRVKVGTRRRLRSSLDEIAGIGPKTRKALLVAFGGIDAIRSASDEALLAVKGVTRRQVKALRAQLENPDGEPVV